MSPKGRSEIYLFQLAGVEIAVDLSWLIVFVLVF
jgi:hypothetical protein